MENKDNNLIFISEENILLDFKIDEQEYIVYSHSNEVFEGDNIYFAKCNNIEGERIIRDIESDEEYQKVVAEYEKLISLFDVEEEEYE